MVLCWFSRVGVLPCVSWFVRAGMVSGGLKVGWIRGPGFRISGEIGFECEVGDDGGLFPLLCLPPSPAFPLSFLCHLGRVRKSNLLLLLRLWSFLFSSCVL